LKNGWHTLLAVGFRPVFDFREHGRLDQIPGCATRLA
jgi:hypothetical protein